MENKNSVFEILSAINVNEKIKEKMGLKYLSWSEAWGTLKKYYPDSFSTIYTRTVKTTETQTVNETDGSVRTVVTETENEIPYFTDGKSCYVKVGVTVEGTEYVEIYPIMNLKNDAAALHTVTMTMVNKAIQRAFTKACARHGLGLYIYSGEDLPEAERKDYSQAKTAADSYTIQEIDEAKFTEIRTQVIEKITKGNFPQEVSDLITQYGASLLKGKRLSQLEYSDIDNRAAIQRILVYIATIESL